MAKILFSWEFGAGLGHLNRFLPVAQALNRDGHEIVLAVPNPDQVTHVREDFANLDGISIRQGFSWPVVQRPDVRKVPTHSLADVLRLFDYHNPHKLADMTAQWIKLVAEVKPDLVVADFSPTLRLAIADSPTLLVLGNGYTTPPAGRLLPPIRPWQEELQAFSRANEASVLESVNRIRWQNKMSAIDHVADLFNGRESMICTIPQFDPYGAYRDRPTLIPFNVKLVPKGPPLEQREGGVVIYLAANHPGLGQVIRAMGQIKAPGDIYVPGGVPEPLRGHWPANLRAHEKPLDLTQYLPQAKLLVHHAGLGTAYAGLLAATPQLVMSHNLEHGITSHGLVQFQCAIEHEVKDSTVESLAAVMRQILGSAEMMAAAWRAADEVVKGDPADSLGQVLAICRSYL